MHGISTQRSGDRTVRAIRLGVIGCGHWGPNHVRVFNALPDSDVVAAADPDDRARERVRALHPGLRDEPDYRTLLADPDIDAVVVATPTATHATIVREALEAGKHVLCEKPLCESADEGESLVALAEGRDLVVMVGHVFLFNPGLVRVKALLEAGDVGDLHYVSAIRTNLGPIRHDVNAAYDLAAHDIAIFNWLLEAEPLTVSAMGACYVSPDREDVAAISLKYPGDVLGTIHVSWLNPKKVRQITVVGSKQMVTWDDLETASPVAVYDKGAQVRRDPEDYGEALRLSMWDGDVRLPKVAFDEPLKLQGAAFLDSVRDGAAERADIGFSLGVVRALQAINASMQEDGRPVPIAAQKVR